MTENTLMRRKTARRDAPAATGVPRPERLWARAVGHGLSRAIGLDATASDTAISSLPGAEAAELVTDGALTVFLDGPDGFGAAILDAGLMAAMLEVQTIGKVLRRPVPPRPLTATDAAMVADPLDRVLAAQETLAEELQMGGMARGYRFATRVTDPRELTRSLSETLLDRVVLELQLGGEMRTGRLTILLPKPGRAAAGAEAVDGPNDWHDLLEDRLLGTEVVLRTELARLRLPIGRVSGLQVGDLLAIPREAIGKVRLVAGGGAVMSTGRLGQAGGFKAVRLEGTAAAEEPFGEPQLAVAKALPGS